MSHVNTTRQAIIASLTLASACMAHAGQSCESLKLTPATIERAMNLAQRTEAELNASTARVVMIARMGQNLSQYRVSYSHVGFAYKTDAGPWRVVHKLNSCNSSDGQVYAQGLGEFFMDDLYRYQAAIVAFAPDHQDKLLAVLQDPERATQLHEPNYSMLSYAWATRYQQSNQWALETTASALERSAQTRTQAQAWLQFKGYQPAVLRIGAITRLGARISKANVAFDDHPNDQRFADRIATATADSVITFMHQARLSAGPTVTVTEFGPKPASKP